MTIENYTLPEDLEAASYSIFGIELDLDINVAFRAVRISEMDLILKHGFQPRNIKSEISFAKSSSATLIYVDEYIQDTDDDVCIFAARFSNSLDKRIVQDGPYLHIYRTDLRPDILPEIIGYCLVPKDYR